MPVRDPALTDRELVARIAAGEEAALGELYDRHGSAVYSLAHAVLGNTADAEEVAADSFTQVWRSATHFDPSRASVAAWLAAITRSRALDRLRAHGRQRRALERAAAFDLGAFALPVAPAGRPPDRGPEESELRELVQRALAELPEAQRRPIELAYFAGLTQSEIAAQLGEPLGTIKTRMRAALEKLRGALQAYLP